MKTILESLIKNDQSYNKSVTRYLYKTHPDLWAQIVSITSFLPNDAKPKQRIWHILNDKYAIECCPITGAALKWNEKDYRRFSSVAAKNKGIGKIISESTTGNHWRQQNPNKSVAANKKFTDGFRKGKHKPWKERNRNYVTSLAAARKTWLKKYGVDNPSKVPAIKQHLSTVAFERYGITAKLRSEYKSYVSAVRSITKKNWQTDFSRIIGTNTKKRSRELHLDHIYSISEGFKNSVPPEIIGHWTNLQLLPKLSNSSKGAKCFKTIEQLYEDYNWYNR